MAIEVRCPGCGKFMTMLQLINHKCKSGWPVTHRPPPNRSQRIFATQPATETSVAHEVSMEIENARVRSTHIGFEDHGIFSFNINFEGEAWGQGTGHMFAEKDLSRLVIGVLRALELEKWEDLPRNLVRIKRDSPNGRIRSVGHALKDKWFEFESIV